MTTPHKWTEENLAILAGMKRAGLTHRCIAERLGVPAGSVSKQAAKIGAKARLDGKRKFRVNPRRKKN